jgi:small subunit ribosomal protein S35
MASLPRRLLLQSRQCPSRIRCRAPPKHTARSISTTSRRFANEDTKPGPHTPAAATPPGQKSKAAASQAESHAPKELTDDEIAAAQLAQLVSDLKAFNPDVAAEAMRKGQSGIPFATDANLENDEDFHIPEDDKRKVAAGFWAEGEPEMGQDEDYYGDDLTSHGHGELQQHRQLREYNRLAAWEMPLLNRTCLSTHPTLDQSNVRY